MKSELHRSAYVCKAVAANLTVLAPYQQNLAYLALAAADVRAGRVELDTPRACLDTYLSRLPDQALLAIADRKATFQHYANAFLRPLTHTAGSALPAVNLYCLEVPEEAILEVASFNDTAPELRPAVESRLFVDDNGWLATYSRIDGVLQQRPSPVKGFSHRLGCPLEFDPIAADHAEAVASQFASALRTPHDWNTFPDRSAYETPTLLAGFIKCTWEAMRAFAIPQALAEWYGL